MKSVLLLVIAVLVFAVMALLDQPYAAVALVADPHELDEIATDCGNPEAPIRTAEMRGVLCPEGYVGVWTQTRPGDLSYCLWDKQEPAWNECSQEITAQGPALPEGALDGRDPEL